MDVILLQNSNGIKLERRKRPWDTICDCFWKWQKKLKG